MRRLAAALALAGVLAAAGCGSSDVDTLQEEVDRLEGQIALQQQQLDKLESETEAIRTLESRLGDIEGLLQGLADRVPELGQLQELLDQLRGLLP